MNNCPCGSGNDYAACCEPIITNQKPAATAEQLMRARYTAHEKLAIDFLFESTHPDHRKGYDHEGTRTWAKNSEWLGLEIVETTDGGPQDTTGDVTFIARFREKKGLRSHHERGQFIQQKGRWFFTQGEMIKGQPVSVNKIGRNDPCHCGSGLKYKKCCGN
ncbi:MAG: YchJ family protein [Geopsychrobacter sp.]|nr:YchJ family protein [Geopsychrobacter sp.]